MKEMLAHPLSALVAAVGAGEIEDVLDVSIEDLSFTATFTFRASRRPQPAVQAILGFEVVPDCAVESSSLIIGVDGKRVTRVRKPGDAPGERCIEDWNFQPTGQGEPEGTYRLTKKVPGCHTTLLTTC